MNVPHNEYVDTVFMPALERFDSTDGVKGHRVIYLCLGGSHAYGTNVPESASTFAAVRSIIPMRFLVSQILSSTPTPTPILPSSVSIN